ncbi:MAG: hypothetical protein ACO3N7_11885, partial [Kiritimatiellia bacterium]
MPDPSPLMSPVFQVILVVLASFGVLTLLTSYLRYRKMELLAMDQSVSEMDAAAVVLLILSALRQKGAGVGMIRFQGQIGDPAEFTEFLRLRLRSGDQLFRLENGTVLALLDCPPENLSRAAERFRAMLEKQGYPQGEIRYRVPRGDPEHLRAWIEEKSGSPSAPGWRLDPAEKKVPLPESRTASPS